MGRRFIGKDGTIYEESDYAFHASTVVGKIETVENGAWRAVDREEFDKGGGFSVRDGGIVKGSVYSSITGREYDIGDSSGKVGFDNTLVESQRGSDSDSSSGSDFSYDSLSGLSGTNRGGWIFGFFISCWNFYRDGISC